MGSLAAIAAAAPLVLLLSCSAAPPARSDMPGPAIAPEALAGDWMLETRVGDQAREGRLHFSFTGGVLAGSVYDADGNSSEMKNIALKDGKIAWEAGGQRYEGTAGTFAMKGTARRVARRQRRDGEDEDAGSGGPPPGRGGAGGYSGGRGGRGGRGGGRGGGSSAPSVTWSAYKSVPSLTPTPVQKPASQR